MESARSVLSLHWIKRVQLSSRTRHLVLDVKLPVAQCGVGGTARCGRWDSSPDCHSPAGAVGRDTEPHVPLFLLFVCFLSILMFLNFLLEPGSHQPILLERKCSQQPEI